MNRIVATAVCLVVGLGIAIAMLVGWLNGRAPSSDSTVRSEVVAPDQAGSFSGDAAMPVKRADAPLEILPPESAVLPFEVVEQSVLRGMDRRAGVLLAQSAEEAAWLDQHGYPTLDQWLNRDLVETEELEDRVKSGDVIAMLILGERVGIAGDFERSQALLEDARIAGSLYANYLAAEGIASHLTSRGLDRSLQGANLTSLALIQLSAVLGDYRAGTMVGSLTLRGDEASALVSVMNGAFAQLDAVNQKRQARGLPPLQPSIRPGNAEWNTAGITQSPVRSWRRRR